MSLIPFPRKKIAPAVKPAAPSTCKHAQLDIEVVRGRCKACGKEVKTAQMKQVLIADQKAIYGIGFKAGYLKAQSDAKAPAAPIVVPANVLEAEAKEGKE